MGGVGVLHDAASAAQPGGFVVPVSWPSEGLAAAQEALRAGGDDAVSRVRAAAGVSANATGGWVAADPAQNSMGYRVGSARWREAASATAQQAAALEAVSEERRRAARFFARADDAKQADADREADHWKEKVFQAARAVEKQKQQGAASAAYGAVGGGVERTGVPKHAVRTVGYRPGSAAARRAAGGLYEMPYNDANAPTGGHSHRLRVGEDVRLERQQVGAQRTLEARAMKRSDDAIAYAEAAAARDAQAAVAMGDRHYGQHAERVATRKTINIGLNTPLAPPGRVHPRAPRSDARHPRGYTIGGGFDRGHAAGVL